MDLPINSVDSLQQYLTTKLAHLQFGTKAQLAFLEDLYTLVSDGIPPNRALDMLTQVTSGINQKVAASISEKISAGQPLADGMQEWFNVNVVEIIRVGEEGGALAETIKSAINSLGQRSSTAGAFLGAMMYPLVVNIMACAIIVYLNGSVFVQFKAIKPMDQWPDAGRQLVAVAGLITHWWWLLLVTLVIVVFVLSWLMQNYVGELRPILDMFPPFNIYRRFCAARVLETLGLLVANGVIFKSAIKVMQYQANPYVLSHLVLMEHYLSAGKSNIADVLGTGLVDKADILRLRVMAEVKGFEHGLVRMGVHGAEETTKTLKLVGKIFGGILMAMGAGLIIIILRGIMLTGMSLGAQ